jgi:hypothetical protein
MNTSKAVGIGFGVLFVALWSLPLTRAAEFHQQSLEYLAEAQSLNASNDVSYSIWLLSSYGVSLLSALVVAWLFSRHPRPIFLIPVAVILYTVIKVIWVQPEEPIVHYIEMAPWTPALFSASAALVSVILARSPVHK